MHAGDPGDSSFEDDEYAGEGWVKSPTHCEDEGGYHCILFNLSLNVSFLMTLLTLFCGILGLLAMRVTRLQERQGWIALTGAAFGLTGIFVFASLFPIRAACVPNFYTTYDNGTKVKEQADTCSYG